MNTSSEHLPKRAKTAALRLVQVYFRSATRTVRLACNHNVDIFDDLLQRRTKVYINTSSENLQKSA